MDKEHVNVENSKRDADYSELLKKIKEEGVCPFCPDNLQKFHPNPILKESKHWKVTENAFPYDGTKHQFLLIHKKHIEFFKEISDEGWVELRQLIKWLEDNYEFQAGSLLLRFGHTKKTGASVQHIHAQIIHSDPDNSNYEPVVTRIG